MGLLHFFDFDFIYFSIWTFCQIFCVIRTWKFETNPIFPLLVSYSFQRLGEINRVNSFSLFVSLKHNMLVLCISGPGFEFMTERKANQFTYIVPLLFLYIVTIRSGKKTGEYILQDEHMFVRTEMRILLRVSTLKKSYII